MSHIEAMKQALEALKDFGNHRHDCPQWPTYTEPEKYPACDCGYDKAITSIDQAIARAEHLEAEPSRSDIKQEPAPTIEDLEQEIYQNTRNFVSLDVMEWMLKRYYTHPQPKQDNTELDAICQDLQEKTYTQAMRIAELEAKLLDKQQFTNVVNPSIHAGSGEKTGEKHQFHHSGVEQEPLASDGSDGSTYKKAIEDVRLAKSKLNSAFDKEIEAYKTANPDCKIAAVVGDLAPYRRRTLNLPDYAPLYTHPLEHAWLTYKREWVGLTVMEAVELELATNHPREFAAAIEAKLKEKNT
jgi:hypothetical protein